MDGCIEGARKFSGVEKPHGFFDAQCQFLCLSHDLPGNDETASKRVVFV